MYDELEQLINNLSPELRDVSTIESSEPEDHSHDISRMLDEGCPND